MSADCVRLSPPANRTTISRSILVKYIRYPGAVIDPHFRNSPTHGPDIAKITRSETLDPDLHSRPRTNIAQSIKPIGENFGFADLKHDEV
jgi:hypothetical protein